MTDSQTILTPLTLSPDMPPAETRIDFVEQVQTAISVVQSEPFLEALDLRQEALKVFYRSFFDYIRKWAEQEKQKHARTPNDPSATPLQEAAIKVREELEDNIINFACCSMSIAHSKGIIAANRAEYNSASHRASKDIQWTKATSQMLYQSLIERQELLDSTKSLALGLHVLGQFEAQHGAVSGLIESVYGQKPGEKIAKSLRSALRNSGFSAGKDILSKLAKPKGLFSGSKKGMSFDSLIVILNSYVDMLQKNVGNLRVEAGSDKIFLNEKELKVVLITQMKELEKTEAFLNKYFMPYIAYVMKKFSFLQDKLAVIGSLDSLLTLYIQMMCGIAQPLQDMKEVREYETNVLEKVKFLLSSQFKEIENLQHLNNEDIQVFHENLGVFKDVMEKDNANKAA